MHYLYRIKNHINNKVYIGQSIEPEVRWAKHKYSAINKPTQVIHWAMSKYGIDNFSFEIIAQCKTQEDANETETLLVKQYESHVLTGKGYNVSNGGSNAPKTEEWKEKVSQSLMRHPVSPETIQKLSLSHMGQIPWNKGLPSNIIPWNLGISMSEEIKKKCSDANKGKHSSPDTEIKPGQRISPDTEIKEGQHLSPGTEFQKGSTPWNKGKKLTEAQTQNKKKLSPEQELIIVNDPRSLRVLAKEFNVSPKTISNIRKRH